jgi:hypothetical protein
LDILRVSEIYQNCRYAKKTPISLGLKKYRYFGDTTGFGVQNNDVCNAHFYKVLLFLKIVNYLTLNLNIDEKYIILHNYI